MVAWELNKPSPLCQPTVSPQGGRGGEPVALRRGRFSTSTSHMNTEKLRASPSRMGWVGARPDASSVAFT